MLEMQRVHPDQQNTVHSKEKSEKSIVSVLHNHLLSEVRDRSYEDMNYADLERILKNVYERCVAELNIAGMPDKIGQEYVRQLIDTMITQIPEQIPGIEEDQLSEVYEHFANAVPEWNEVILRQALRSVPQTQIQRWNRFRLARTLITLDKNFFSQLSQFGFPVMDQIDIARRVCGKYKMNLFEFAASTGGLTDEFRETVFEECSQGMQWYLDFKKLSPNEAADLIRDSEEDTRIQLRSILNIPPRSFLDAQKMIPLSENRFEKSFYIDVDHMRSLGDQLHEKIMRMAPERAERMEKKKLREQVLHRPIVAAGELNSDTSASPGFLYLEGEEIIPAIYKPQARDEENMRSGIPAGTYAQREWLAYQIDQSLGIDVIPPTILRDGPDGVGSVQEWVIAKTAGAYGKWEEMGNPEQLEDVVFDDVVKKNQDRHGGNFLVGHDGSVYAIDHGLILAITPDAGYIKSTPGSRMIGKPPSERVVERIQQFRSSTDVQEALRACFEAALGTQANDAWKIFEDGLEQLAPNNGSEGVYPTMI